MFIIITLYTNPHIELDEQRYYNKHIKYQPTQITGRSQLYVWVGILYVHYNNLFMQFYVRVGILYVHYNNAVRRVI
jgi:hypothetical protein